MPHIGGSDIAGDVDAVGEGVDASVVGSRVVVDPSLHFDGYQSPSRGQRGRPRFGVIGEQTQGGLAEFAIVPAANLVPQGMWDACIRSLATGGRLVTYGATTGPLGQLDIRRVFWKQLSILGTTMGSPTEFRAVMKLVFDGTIEPVIADTLPLERARQAHERLEAGGVFGKLLVVP